MITLNYETQSIRPDWKRIVDMYVNKQTDSIHLNSSERCRIIIADQNSGEIILNNRKVKYNAPTLFCLNQNDIIKAAGQKLLCLYFHPKVINDELSFEFLSDTPYDDMGATTKQDAFLLNTFYSLNLQCSDVKNISAIKSQQIISLINKIYDELTFQPDYYWPCRSRSYLIEILFCINQLELSSVTDDLSSESGQIIDYISQNISEKITLPFLTEKFLLNRNKLNETVKQKTGMTAMQYLSDMRKKVACYLLSDTELSITEIASRVGFDTLADFSTFFKKNVEISPRLYRDKYHNEHSGQ